MGMWYGSELINHRDDTPEDKSYNEIVNTCVVVHLSEIDVSIDHGREQMADQILVQCLKLIFNYSRKL